MDMKEFYEKTGGDYEGVLSRLMNERIMKKFVFKFLDDPSFRTLKRALNSGDSDEAFRAAHTLKGVCQNLGFTRLYESSSALTEALRNKETDNIAPYFEKTESVYNEIAGAINEIDV